jgi:hypothetical protein
MDQLTLDPARTTLVLIDLQKLVFAEDAVRMISLQTITAWTVEPPTYAC